MLAAREDAIRADAERWALQSWAAAVAKQREGDAAFERGEAGRAERAYREAGDSYVRAGREAQQVAADAQRAAEAERQRKAQEAQRAAEAERQRAAAEAERQKAVEAERQRQAALQRQQAEETARLAPLQQETERARSAAVSAREQALRVEAEKVAKALFEGARVREQEADSLASRQSFAAATQAYGDAALRYGAAAQRAQLARAARSEADQARGQMLDAKKRASPGTAGYQAGVTEEQQGQLAYERGGFKQAADRFRAAEAAFAGTPGGAPGSRAPGGDARVEIQAALDTYKRAIEAKDLALLQKIRPGLTAAELRRIREAFAQGRSQSVDLSVQGIDVAGDEAEARGRRLDVFVSKDGQTFRSEGAFVFKLRRLPSGWVIDAVN